MPKAKTSSKRPSKPAEQPPSWPRFKPALPVADLAPQLHPATSKIALIPSFFPRSLCRDFVAFLRTLPLQTTPGRPRRGEATRVNDRFQVDDGHFARRLWEETGLKEALSQSDDVKDLWGGKTVGLNSNIRVYRYTTGQYFDCHYDDDNDVEVLTDPPTPARTTWTLLLYLTSSTEGCVGGETVFYKHDRKCPSEAITVPPETGLLLLHKHGADCLLHEGREVTAGEKWVLRTDLCVRRVSSYVSSARVRIGEPDEDAV
ncbi:Prolyl 4-hydroxylase, alpha subunit [Ophiocordyceps camponoti-floridani]|uniref:Prolyl 4-hydroxylase, alpha subunit n=1 Tax=Ophiocordyceps camponoti-floridani TaxID=2030778 RepID=A0A8H4Q2P9_9HYPO|nr:Prolyl 4-hydroxylase, alpha subunit [Ophiocordyceps camponoti-floridani]